VIIEYSILWKSSRLTAFAVEFPPEEVEIDFCAFGAPWRRRTRLWGWNLSLVGLCKPCRGGKVCSFSGKPHIRLSGRDAAGSSIVRMAEPYPVGLCRALAIRFCSAHQEALLAAMLQATRP